MTPTVKVANRHMIYTEILAAVLSLVMGAGVLFTRGTIWAAMGRAPDFLGLSYRAWIGGPIVAFSFGLLVVCALEWDSGRRWDKERLWRSAVWREWLCLLLCLAMLTMAIEVVRFGSFFVAPIVVVQACILSIAFAFAAIKNRRLCVVLDDRYPTTRLQARMPESW